MNTTCEATAKSGAHLCYEERDRHAWSVWHEGEEIARFYGRWAMREAQDYAERWLRMPDRVKTLAQTRTQNEQILQEQIDDIRERLKRLERPS